MASIFQRGSRFYISFKNGNGKWVKRSAGKTYDEAERRLRQLDQNGPAAENALTPLVAAYLQKLEVYSKPASRRNAQLSCALLLQHFGTHCLDQEGLDAFVALRLRRVKPKSVNNDLITLRAILNYAVALGRISAFPFRIRLLKTSRKRVLPVLSKDDIESILRCASPRTYGVLLLCSKTGFRLGEVLNLTWRDVYFNDCALAVTEKSNWSPKSHQQRTVFVTEEVISYLAGLRRSLPNAGPNDYLFPNKDGSPMSVENACRMLRDVFRRAGIYQKGFPLTHWIRHSVGSQMLLGGVDLETVRDVLGHADITTTALYLHGTEKAKRDATKALPW